MNSRITKILPVLLLLGSFSLRSAGQRTADPWTASQLIEPAALNALLHNLTVGQPVILDVGPAGVIQGAITIGPVHEKEKMEALNKELKQLPKDAFIVIYCGCCPFDKCPNVRPAFRALMKSGFKNAHLLDLPHNLKADWIDKGYPLAATPPKKP